jgi:hypothetical protein
VPCQVSLQLHISWRRDPAWPEAGRVSRGSQSPVLRVESKYRRGGGSVGSQLSWGLRPQSRSSCPWWRQPNRGDRSSSGHPSGPSSWRPEWPPTGHGAAGRPTPRAISRHLRSSSAIQCLPGSPPSTGLPRLASRHGPGLTPHQSLGPDGFAARGWLNSVSSPRVSSSSRCC